VRGSSEATSWSANRPLSAGHDAQRSYAQAPPIATGAAEAVKAESDMSYYPVLAVVVGVFLSGLVAIRFLLLRRRRSRNAPVG
jgi:hypothetical protein